MPIDAYTGWPGSGKSHTVVQHVVLPALKAGRTVVTNIPMKAAVLAAELPGCDLRTFDVEKFESKARACAAARSEHERRDAETALRKELDDSLPPGCVWVLDEVWRLWPAGQKADKVPEPFKAILAEHRHRVDQSGNSMQIALVSQDLAQVGKFARDLVETTYRTEKLSSLGISRRFRVDVYRGGVQGARPPAALLLRKTFGKYSADVWKFYESHTKRDGAGDGANESKVDTRGLIWKSPRFWLLMPLMIVALPVSVWGVWRFFHPERPERSAEATQQARPRGVPVHGAASRRSFWRIVASIEGDGIGRVYLRDGARHVSVPIKGYCDKDSEGFFICEFEGQRISGQVQIDSPVEQRIGAGSVLTSTLGAVSASSGAAAE